MKRILLIEDYKTARELYQSLLEKEGFEVVAVDNGRNGLDQMSKGHFDLVIVDLILPDLGARDLIQQLITISPKITIAVTYTIGSEPELEPIRQIGVRHFILKSTTTHEEVVRTIKSLLSP